MAIGQPYAGAASPSSVKTVAVDLADDRLAVFAMMRQGWGQEIGQ